RGTAEKIQRRKNAAREEECAAALEGEGQGMGTGEGVSGRATGKKRGRGKAGDLNVLLPYDRSGSNAEKNLAESTVEPSGQAPAAKKVRRQSTCKACRVAGSLFLGCCRKST
ncbi:unnamed protein product, partial [Pylaiella littoralis]